MQCACVAPPPLYLVERSSRMHIERESNRSRRFWCWCCTQKHGRRVRTAHTFPLALCCATCGRCSDRVPCPPGTEDDDRDATTPCKEVRAVGVFCPGGSATCKPCAAGTWDHDEHASTACVACEVGTVCKVRAGVESASHLKRSEALCSSQYS